MSIAQTVALNGFAHIPAYRPELSTEDTLLSIGLLETIGGLRTIQTLTPKDTSNSNPNTYSGNFGIANFPLHTDLAHWSVPPRYLALRCIKGAPDVYTRVLPGDNLVKSIGRTNLQATLAQPRRPIKEKIHLLRLLDCAGDKYQDILRWDNIFIKPATAKSNIIFEAVRDYLAISSIIEICLSMPGDILVIDNWRCLHGRSSAANSKHRQIERGYLSSLK